MEAPRGEPAVTRRTAAGTEAVHLHDFIENGELERELDGVGQGLGSLFIDPFIDEDLANDSDVECYAQDVKVDEELLRMTHPFRVSGREPDHRGADIYDGNDEFLEGEHDQLNALVNLEYCQPHAGSPLCAAEFLDSGRDLEEAEIHNDHDEYSAEDALVAHDEMQARIQHQALSGHHAPPSEGGEGRVDLPGTAAYEPFEYHAEGMADDAPGRH